MTVGVYSVSEQYASELEAERIREAKLFDLEGNAWQVARLKEKIGILFFGYTFCPDVCPVALTNLTVALDGIGKERKNFIPIFVSVDPARDTPKVIGDYIGHFDKGIIGLTGSEPQLKSFAWAFGAAYTLRRSKAKSDDYIVDHTANFFLVTSEGRRFPLPIRDNPDAIREFLVNAKETLTE